MVVEGVEGTGPLVIAELAEDTEVTVVLGVTTGSEDVVSRVVEKHQLRDIDVFSRGIFRPRRGRRPLRASTF